MSTILALTQKEFGHKELYSSLLRQGATPLHLKRLATNIDWQMPKVDSILHTEGALKIFLKTEDGLFFESVLIQMRSSLTLCLSSQVGCAMACRFCETGRMGLRRHLKVDEIVSQLFHAKFTLGQNVKNLVFMGMGEPFDNFDAVMQAVRIFTDPYGFGVGMSNVTISTSGKVDEIYRLIEEADPALNLAVSVNAPRDEVRTKLMPINRKYNMQKLYEAMLAYCRHPRRKILIEYVLIEGHNSEIEDAKDLARYLQGLKVKINLIPYNAQSGSAFLPPAREKVNSFASELNSFGFRTFYRQPKGRSIMAACGQLGKPWMKFSRSNQVV